MATLSRKRGAAGTRFEPLVVPGGWIPLGTTATIPVALPRGVWELSIQYRSPVELKLRAPGLRRTVLPNLDVPGPLWRVGVVTASGTVKVSIDVPGTWLARKRLALVSSLAFVRADDRLRVLPLRESCGKFVDWYRIDGEASSDGRTS